MRIPAPAKTANAHTRRESAHVSRFAPEWPSIRSDFPRSGRVICKQGIKILPICAFPHFRSRAAACLYLKTPYILHLHKSSLYPSRATIERISFIRTRKIRNYTFLSRAPLIHHEIINSFYLWTHFHAVALSRRVIFPILSRLCAGLFNSLLRCPCVHINPGTESALACSDNKLLVFSPSYARAIMK